MGQRIDPGMNETAALALEAHADALDRLAAQATADAERARAQAAQLRNSEDRVPNLLTVKEAASRSGLSDWAIRQLVSSQAIASTRIGTKVYVSTSSLDRLADAS